MGAADALSQGERVFVVLRRSSGKEWYDLVVQFPTGQIELFDVDKKHPHVVTPHPNAALILLTTAQDLVALEELGFPIRSVTGLTFQQ